LLGSARGLFWAFILMCSVNYIFAMLFLGEALAYVREHPEGNETTALLDDYWGSMATALRSLFMAVSGGDDWSNIAAPFWEFSTAYGYLFVVYVFIIVCGMLNIMNGVFVDAALLSSKSDADLVDAMEAEAMEETIKAAKAVFKSIGNELTERQFQELLTKKTVKDFFRGLDMDIEEAKCFFTLLDVDSSHTLDLDEFIQGCLRLQGAAKKIHVAAMLSEHKKVTNAHERFFNQLAMKLHSEFERLDVILGGTLPGQHVERADSFDQSGAMMIAPPASPMAQGERQSYQRQQSYMVMDSHPSSRFQVEVPEQSAVLPTPDPYYDPQPFTTPGPDQSGLRGQAAFWDPEAGVTSHESPDRAIPMDQPNWNSVPQRRMSQGPPREGPMVREGVQLVNGRGQYYPYNSGVQTSV